MQIHKKKIEFSEPIIRKNYIDVCLIHRKHQQRKSDKMLKNSEHNFEMGLGRVYFGIYLPTGTIGARNGYRNGYQGNC